MKEDGWVKNNLFKKAKFSIGRIKFASLLSRFAGIFPVSLIFIKEKQL